MKDNYMTFQLNTLHEILRELEQFRIFTEFWYFFSLSFFSLSFHVHLSIHGNSSPM